MSDFFDPLWEEVIILKKAIDCHLFSNRSIPPDGSIDGLSGSKVFDKGTINNVSSLLSGKEKNALSALDQSKILSCFLKEDYNAHNVSQTLWKRLRCFYDEEEWGRIRVVKGQGDQLHHDDAYLRRNCRKCQPTFGKAH